MNRKIRKWNDIKSEQFCYLFDSAERKIICFAGHFESAATWVNTDAFEEEKRYIHIDFEDIKSWKEVENVINLESGKLIINPDSILEYDDEKLKIRIRSVFADSSWIKLKNSDTSIQFIEKLNKLFKGKCL